MQEISWDTATRTANHNVRIAGTVRIVRDGQWEFRLNEANAKASWWAKNLETGELVRTGHRVMTDVRRFMYQRARTNNPQLTITSGPQRSRAGHQRYTTAFAAA
jgi:hypothetical protein